ncbi:MAG: NUDIX domain-containing protein [Planctomycetes bacterium]|nr:NUDIX domain-containing protein [Planctomycetota bacterium]
MPADSPADSTRVGIAVVEHAGRFLVGVRGSEGPLAGLYEFPGGKCRDSEDTASCAMRECLEETGLEVVARRRLMARTFDYPHGRVELEFWLCQPRDPADVSQAHRGFRWSVLEELPRLSFPEANAPVIELLCSGRDGGAIIDAEDIDHRRGAIPVDANEPIVVCTLRDAAQAEVIRNALEAEGIECAVEGARQAALTGAVDVRLLVPAHDAERARAFIAAHEASPGGRDEEE